MMSRTRSIGSFVSSATPRRSSSLTGSTIWLVWPWSAVAITSVLPSFLAKSSAFFTASSKTTVSPICPHGSAAWSRLSIDALST